MYFSSKKNTSELLVRLKLLLNKRIMCDCMIFDSKGIYIHVVDHETTMSYGSIHFIWF